MRILSGLYAKREIPVVGRTRPLLLRIRQSIFDILSNPDLIHNQTILDLCAGSGSFGLEALSRGAKFVCFFEENRDTARNLIQTLKQWQVSNAQVKIKNIEYLPALTMRAQLEEKLPEEMKPPLTLDPPLEGQDLRPDLIFLDPPFGHSYIQNIQKKLIDKNWTKPNTHLVIRADHKIPATEGWHLYRLEEFGISYVHFYSIAE